MAPTPPSIVPASPLAREILEEAMTAWRRGRPPGMLDREAPRVQVIDSFRKPGQTLRGHAVLSETASPRARTFTVRLDLAGPEAHENARFLLVGIDPVLVFRQEDYDLLTHFEHKMEPEPEASAGEAKR